MSNEAKPESEDTLQAKLAKALNAAVKLKVVTYVGAVELSGTLDALAIAMPTGKPGEDAIVTSIDLVQGDIVNIVPTRFWAPEQVAVREFHQQQVGEAKEIVDRNLNLILKAGKAMVGLASSKP